MKTETTSIRLKRILTERNMRQVDILNAAQPHCRRLGVKLGKNDLSQYVSGKVEPRQDKLSILALALGVSEAWLMGYEVPMHSQGASAPAVRGDIVGPIDFSQYQTIPILGRIPAGLPVLAEQNIEGYTLTDLNRGGEYFALRVRGDSMNAMGIQDGYLIIVRRQSTVENGQVAVVMVGEDDATVKRFYATGHMVTLMPQSTNPVHTPQVYDTRNTNIQVLGRVVKVEFML